MCHHVPCLSFWPHHSPPSTTHKFPSLSFFSFNLSSLSLSLLSSHHSSSFFDLQLQFHSSSVISESDTRTSARMRNPNSLKREFLQKWMKGLGKCGSLKNNMSFLERKKAIKLSADLAMASTRSGATRWSQAIITEASSSRDDNGYEKILMEQIVGSPENQKRLKGKVLSTTMSSSSSSLSGLCRSRMILKRSCMVRRVVMKKKKRVGSPKMVAKRLVKKRTRMLKSLLPGGESMDDDVVLIEETLDYIKSLIAQVEVMRCLATASELIKNS